MKKVMFICHGNICRSTMAEMMLNAYVQKSPHQWMIESSGTSREEIGNDIHPGTKKILDKYHIPYEKRRAKQITKDDFDTFDYLICMDESNVRNLIYLYGNSPKISLLLSYCGINRGIKDPWYSGNFEETFEDIRQGIDGFLKKVEEEL